MKLLAFIFEQPSYLPLIVIELILGFKKMGPFVCEVELFWLL